MPSFNFPNLAIAVALLVLFARPAHAFGAGNIAATSAIEGTNWRHGDIEDTLLLLAMSRAAGGKKFDKMSVSRVYFGNWLRDYSQAIDVGTVKYVSAEAIRILLWVLGFMTFGYGTGEFEVTAERLGCYRPEDHIDNPKDYADNLDATQYDRRLRGPVDERVELAIDQRRGMKNYIASEEIGITTSAGHVRKLFSKCIQLGRSYGRSKNKDELYEALRLLGTGLHCLEDFSAHSNYIELALIEMGETDVFPLVGRNTQIRLQGARSSVYPLVTGTFGGVDFLHSVMGEFDDKATQSEIQQLEGTMQNGKNADTSFLRDILNKIPSGIFGDDDEAGKAEELRTNATTAQMNQIRVSPREPEAFTRQMQECVKQIYPIIEWHDNLMKKISSAIEKIPILPELIEQLENQVNIFVFSLLAPFVLPLINQMKNELNEGSSEIISSSKAQQHNVFQDDQSSDPTHSMLSKDHFSSILNEPAGKISSGVLKWVVPQLIACWDDERQDIDRTCTRIIEGVLHHPALRHEGQDGASDGRQQMFSVVEQWWTSKGSAEQRELRGKLSRSGIQNGENHKEGVVDTGHGCCKPIGMAKSSASQGAGGGGGGGMISDLVGALSGGQEAASAGSGYGRPTKSSNSEIEKFASEAAGGGALGGIVGALAGGIGGGLLSDVFGDKETKKTTQRYESGDGSVTQSYTEYGSNRNETAQAQYSETKYPSGAQTSEYGRYEQSQSGQAYEGHVQRQQQRGNEVRTEEWRQGRTAGGDEYQTEVKTKEYHSGGRGGKKDSDDDDSGDDSDYKRKKREKKERKKREEREREQQQQSSGYGGGGGGGYGQESRHEERSGGYGEQRQEQRQEYGGGGGGGYGQQRQEYGGGGGGYEEPRREQRQEQQYGGGGGYGQESRREEYGGGGGGGYGQESRREEYGGGGGGGYGQESRREEYGGGGGGGGYGQESRREHHGGGRRDDDDERRGGGYGGGEERREHGRGDEYGRGERRY
ncbi:hypothetical protein VE01_05706 [Pseudogymnoascus verrucosus]|uniref:Het-C-domain-containing protein n=1 Tax=Pseudogymnoascus verrucosus TaxID=342668 RepID=A0A1B8GKP2_9PEZI|nr:uncharacterized protein VE01_05706 [Pseudogymnoascus verrucosus]OBT96413.1 hypothetical protein VE01_05706 [Pseudogymnoascus verrucosus]